MKQDVWSALAQVEKKLEGIQDDQSIASHSIVRNIMDSQKVCVVRFQREGDDVRTMWVKPNAFNIMGIPKEKLEGKMLSEYSLDRDVMKDLEYLDKVGFMVKHMSFPGISTTSIVVKETGGRYIEFIWRDEL